MLEMSPWGAGYKDFCVFVFSPFRKIFRCFNFLGGYWIFWWPRLDSLKDGIMFAESGVANGRVPTPFLFALCALIASLDRELINSKFTGHAHAKKGKRGGIAVQPHRELKKVTL